MENGKVLQLYMTMPDLMRSGHRMVVDSFECDENGIVGDVNYGDDENMLLLVSKKSYDIIRDADLVLDQGFLMENIYVDIDINHLKKGSLIEIGDVVFEVIKPCESYTYLYAFDPNLPELIHKNRGIFIKPIEYGQVEVGNKVTILKEII